MCISVNTPSFLQSVPHHIRSSMGLNYDFRDESVNLRKMNYFKKLNEADIKFVLQKVLGISKIMFVFWP